MRIGIVAAEQQEIERIQTQLHGQKTKKAGMLFYEAAYGKHTVISACCGIGKVHAAVCTQILISEYKVEQLINTGTAGSLRDTLGVFDMVVSTDAVQHDVNACVFGYQKGQVPGTASPFWEADAALRTCALKAFDVMKNEAHGDFQDTHTMAAGRIASGDSFISEPIHRQSLIEHFHADCVEMEGAAIAHVCSLNGIPFVILRCISDNAGEPALLSYQQFSEKAAKISALLVLKMLELL